MAEGRALNPLREVPIMLMPYLPDTPLGQGIAMAAGVIATLGLIGGAAGLGLYIANKMGYLE